MAALAVSVPAARAQDNATPAPILVLNQDRLLSQTRFGQRIQAELEAASSALSAENRRIEADLTEEELALTGLRPTTPAEEFRALADEFDTRVRAIRAAQDAKARDLQGQAEAAQQRFFEEIVPVLLELVQAREASVLLDSRTVLLSAGGIDVTDAAIAAIDAVLGDGGPAPIIALPGVGGGGAPEQ